MEQKIVDNLRKRGVDEATAKAQASAQVEQEMMRRAEERVNKEIQKAIVTDPSRIADVKLKEIAIILQGCVNKCEKLGEDHDKAQEHVFKDITGTKA